MTKSAYKLFMSCNRATIKQYIRELKALKNEFFLSDEDIEKARVLQAWLTVYHTRFMQYTRTKTSKTAFIKMFS